MATDGVKIIDSDLASDTYNGIMDLYDSGASIETIRKEIPFGKTDLGSDADFHHEIFVTAYALAFWEIGELTQDILDEVKRVIELKEGVKVWRRECDETEGKNRQKVLDKFWKKIIQSNLKIRKRKKYKLITNLYFQPDDLLTFKLTDDYYYAVVCAKVTQQRGQCTYDLVPTTYKGRNKPTEEDLTNCYLSCLRISSGFNKSATLAQQPGIDKIWRYYKRSDNFFLGLNYCFVTHRDMISLKGKFEKVGILRIKESFKRNGSYGYESSFDRFENIFSDLESHMKVFGQEKFPANLICE